MGYPNGQVDIPGLAKVGGPVTHAAEAFDKAFAGQVAALRPGSTMTGWATDAALQGATQVWSTFVKNLAAQVTAFGAGLTKASADYEATDSAAAARISVAGTGTPAGHPAGAGVFGQGPR